MTDITRRSVAKGALWSVPAVAAATAAPAFAASPTVTTPPVVTPPPADTAGPVITALAPRSFPRNQAIAAVQVEASDPSVPLIYTAVGLPSGLNIDPDTGTISGTPANVGSYPVTITATDAAGNSSQTSVTFTVTLDLRLELIYNTPDAGGTTTAQTPNSTRTANSAYFRVGYRNAGTDTIPAGQKIKVDFNVTGTGSVRVDWYRPQPSTWFEPSSAQSTEASPVSLTRTYTNVGDRALAPGAAVSFSPGLFTITGAPASTAVVQLIGTEGVQLTKSTMSIDNLIQPVANWTITGPA